MNHASDLRSHTLCDLANRELPVGDRSLAALILDTQAQVDCPMCRQRLGLSTPGMWAQP